MADGIRTTNFAKTDVADAVVVNYGDSTRAMDMDKLGAQLAADGPISNAITAAATGIRSAKLWTQLSAVSGTLSLQKAEVTNDAGTHTDPVTGLTVPNEGQYSWSVSPAGWTWTKALLDIAAVEAFGVRLDDAVIASFRRSLYLFEGTGDPANIPVSVSIDNKVIQSVNAKYGYDSNNPGVAGQFDQFRANIMMFTGSGDIPNPPTKIALGGTGGKVIETRDQTTGKTVSTPGGSPPLEMVYISAGTLRVIGGNGLDRALNTDAGKTWLAVQTFRGCAQGIFLDGSNVKHQRVISTSNGALYPNGTVQGITGDGQSNGENQSNGDRSLVFSIYPYPENLWMPYTLSYNIWLGKTTSGGTSVELTASEITDIVPLRGAIAPTNTHGTSNIELAMLRYAERADRECGGWVPKLIGWNNSEGGQYIANMLSGAPVGSYYFANVITAVTKVNSLLNAKGFRFSYAWMLMAQGENDVADTALGSKHELLRSQVEAAVVPITNQIEPLRMISWQMSSFLNASAGARSILDLATDPMAIAAGRFFNAGATYIFPYSAEDYLHHTSVGHAMRGEYEAAIMRLIERSGGFLPLHAKEAHITGSNEITVTLSEAARNDETWLVSATGLANKGIVVPGKTVSSVNVSGTSLVITTSGSASGATTVEIGMVGHASTRAATTIPRTTIRSDASLGTFMTGQEMYKPLCHQQISIT